MSEIVRPEPDTSHDGQVKLLADYLRKYDWHVETKYKVENKRIDLIAWYRYDDIILITESKTDLKAEIGTAIGHLSITKALIKKRYPEYKIQPAIIAPYDQVKEYYEFVPHGTWSIVYHPYDEIIIHFPFEPWFEKYMAYKLSKAIEEKLPRKLEFLLKEEGLQKDDLWEYGFDE